MTDLPSWDELLASGQHTAASAAAARGVTTSAAKAAARRRNRRWVNPNLKVTDDDLRRAAAEQLHFTVLVKRHGVGKFCIYRRVAALPDLRMDSGCLRRAGQSLRPKQQPPKARLSASPGAVARFVRAAAAAMERA